MSKRPSGSARERERKLLAREAERPADYREKMITRAKRMLAKTRGGDAESILSESMNVLRFVYREALTDPGPPPEQCREQAARAAAAAIKAADPKKLIDERGALLREAEALILTLRDNAPQEHPAGGDEPSGSSSH